MNTEIINNVITNSCCFDFENSPVLPGDIVCCSKQNKHSVYIKNVYEINPNNNKIKIKSIENLKTPGNFCWINAKYCLNITKKYQINIKENIQNILAEEETLVNNQIIKKYIFGFAIENNNNILFQIPVESTPGKIITIFDIKNALNKYGNTFHNISILIETNNSFDFYDINNLKSKNIKFFNIKYPLLNSSQFYFYYENNQFKELYSNKIIKFDRNKYSIFINNIIIPLLKKYKILPPEYGNSIYKQCYL